MAKSAKAKHPTPSESTVLIPTKTLPTIVVWIVAAVSGAAVMGFEIIAARMIGHHLGSTPYVWGGVIGVVMAALSFGYWLGGRLADRRPQPHILAMTLMLGGASVVLIPMVLDPVCQTVLSWHLPISLEVIVPCVLMFFLPSVLLGVTSPFLVKLAAKDLSKIGNTAGGIYAISTFGSIIGVFLTTFALIPSIASTYSLLIWAISVGVVSLLLFGFGKVKLVPATLFLCITVFGATGGVFASSYTQRQPAINDAQITIAAHFSRMSEVAQKEVRAFLPGKVVEYAETVYHDIEVVDKYDCLDYERDPGDPTMPSEVRSKLALFCKNDVPSRAMRFGPYTETEIRTEDEHLRAVSEFYTELFFLPMIWIENPTHFLFVGAGGGVGPRMMRDTYPQSRIDLIEVDGKVIDLARRYFGLDRLDNDPLFFVHVGDGRAMFHHEPLQGLDVVILDAFSIGGNPPFHLMTEEYLKLVKSRMVENGVCMSNVISSIEGASSQLFHAQLKTYESVFKYVYVFPHVRGTLDQHKLSWRQNIMMLGTDRELSGQIQGQPLSPSYIDERAKALAAKLIANQSPWIEPRLTLAASGVLTKSRWESTPEYRDAPILKDEYAPVEILATQDRVTYDKLQKGN